MQHLLDFVHEHTLEDQLYLVAHTPVGDIELLWRRGICPGEERLWQLRPYQCEGPWELVHAGDLLDHLEARGVDMNAIELELASMVATQIAFADLLLRNADEALGRETVQRARRGYQQFVSELKLTVDKLTGSQSGMTVVAGGGDQTEARAGHLTLVRGS
jgi:hypothetical protein